MPKFDMNDYTIPGGNSFKFSGVRPEDLTESEYTLVTIEVDVSGSVGSYSKELKQALIDVVEACKKSPKAANLLVRIVVFNEKLYEIHGFKPLASIDTTKDYSDFNCSGGTALFDATYDAIGSTLKYADILSSQDFSVNGITFVITDGDDNSSGVTPKVVAERIEDALKSEKIDSLNAILVGVNTASCGPSLDRFNKEAKLSQYVDIGDATPAKLAKLAQFVSKSISSTSTMLGIGKPADPITF